MSDVAVRNVETAAQNASKPSPYRGPYMLQVVRTEQLAPSYLRVVLGGESLASYNPESAGAHLKLLVPRPGQEKPFLPIVGEGRPKWEVAPEERPFVRTYSIRSIDVEQRELTIEFVLHHHDGPAASWARNAKVGDWVAVSASGSRHEFPAHTKWYLFAGDATALPSIMALIERLPASAEGIVLLEVANEGEIIAGLDTSPLPVRWLLREDAESPATFLLDAIRAVEVPVEHAAVYVAGEATEMSAIRAHFRQTLKMPREQVYVLPYWKRGDAEEAYHAQRHVFMDEDEA